MEQPTTQTVYGLFNGRIQFIVPVYQRAYVWNEAENWGVLWEDIADTAERYLDDPAAQVPYRHFLGPIVLDQQHSGPGEVDQRLVIDGQQRLMTMQIILSATASVAEERGSDDVSGELSELTFNHGRAAEGKLRFKVWPSRRDRKAFLGVMENGTPSNGPGISGAWWYFYDQIGEWVTDDGEADGARQRQRIEALHKCLDSLLYVVSINLDESDNAQIIFETLNARGTGLGALDLVKNAIFLQAERENAPAAVLHDDYWEPTFEADDYWLEEVRQGREKRARADWFLMHWLAMELGQVVRADKLFDSFRKEVLRGPSPPSMEELVPRLCQDAKIMRSFDSFDPGTPEALFFSRLEALDTTTMLPIALLLFRSAELDQARRRAALAALESWLVRRAILRLTAKNYNRTLTSLLTDIKSDLAHADEAVVRELRSSEAATAIWPTDASIRARLQDGDLYGYVGQSRVRMLLEACELDVRDPAKTEAIALPAGLSIEHALPQSWEKHWPLPDCDDPEQLRLDREAHVDRLGNLTLVTQPLNSALSNAAWLSSATSPHSKRAELAKRSVLLINQQLCQHEHWNEQLIDARGVQLTDRILRTWPGPGSDIWPSGSPPVHVVEPSQTSQAQPEEERPAAPARSTPWTVGEVLDAVAQAGKDEAAVAGAVRDWAAAHPYVQITGGTGMTYPSFTMLADSGRNTSRFRGVLSLYASPHGESPMLEIRVKRMCRTPPYNQNETRKRLTADLHALGIPRLDAEKVLIDKRPNIPLRDLTDGRADRLLAIVDQWIKDVRARAEEPETGEES